MDPGPTEGAGYLILCSSGLILLGAFGVPFGGLLGAFWVPFRGVLGAFSGPFGCVLGAFWDFLRAFWGFWGLLFQGLLGAFLGGLLGAFCGPLGVSSRLVECILGVDINSWLNVCLQVRQASRRKRLYVIYRRKRSLWVQCRFVVSGVDIRVGRMYLCGLQLV